MQTLQVNIPVPADMVLIKRVDYEDMLTRVEREKIWNMNDLEDITGRGQRWLKENILYVYRDELDLMQGGFVKYPEKQGEQWKFEARRMSDWLDAHLKEVM